MTSTCACGCGGAPPIAKQNDRARGYVKGQPVRYIRGHSGGAPAVPLKERFWDNVDASDADGCWPWLGVIMGNGYGRAYFGPKALFAHRVSYELTHGSIPAGMVVRHACDNPPCVNPSHLLIGTHLDNVRDAVERGRIPHGSRASAAKLTEAQVLEIRRLRAQGRTQYEVADLFGVHRSTIKDIDTGRSWKRLGAAA